MLNYDISSCCKILKFSRNMLENSENIEAETHQDYLLKLLRLEIEHREAARRERLIKGARFHAIKTFDSFNFNDVILPGDVTKDYLRECRFLEEKKNLVFYGNIVQEKLIWPQPWVWKHAGKGKVLSFSGRQP